MLLSSSNNLFTIYDLTPSSDTTYFTNLEKQIADAKGAPPPIIEENPREDTTTATEVDRNVGPPKPFQVFD